MGVQVRFPKKPTVKRRRHHPDSIMNQPLGSCFLCWRLEGNGMPAAAGLERHHIYDGPNRMVSEENGFVVYLCHRHHRNGPEAVHVNIERMRFCQRECQKTYEKMHSRADFMRLIGRSYLEDT
jgi:hypothetical protein